MESVAQVKPLVSNGPMPTVQLDNALAVTTPQAVAVVVPKESWLTRFEKSPTGEAFRLWSGGVGAVGATVLPAVAMGVSGSMIGGIHAAVGGESSAWGIGLGCVAGIAAAIYTNAVGVDLYTSEKKSHPYARTFRDVAMYLVAPAVVAGVAVAELSSGGFGVIASVVAGVIGSSFGLTTDAVREKRIEEAKRLGASGL